MPSVSVERHGNTAIVIVRKNFVQTDRDGETFYEFDERHGVTPWFDGIVQAIENDVDAWFDHFENIVEHAKTVDQMLEAYSNETDAAMFELAEYISELEARIEAMEA
ncbi:MAG: hypothetical protein KBT28_12465 [Bacteroidales bacterium]|nr:hypothetical protein [Candidatus Colimorpha merdihippi]